jgi:hypothetical protein
MSNDNKFHENNSLVNTMTTRFLQSLAKILDQATSTELNVSERVSIKRDVSTAQTEKLQQPQEERTPSKISKFKR